MGAIERDGQHIHFEDTGAGNGSRRTLVLVGEEDKSLPPSLSR